MFRLILCVAFLFFINASFSQQADTSSQINQLENSFKQIQNEKSKIENTSISLNLKSSYDYVTEIKKLNQQILTIQASNKANDNNAQIQIDKLKGLIDSLTVKLDTAAVKEKEVTNLNNQLKNLKEEIISLQKYKELTTAEKLQSDELLTKVQTTNNEILRSEISAFVGNIQGWKPLTADLQVLAKTAESVLLFDERTGKKIWSVIKTSGLDMLSIGSAALALNDFQKDKRNSGYTYLGAGVVLKFGQGFIKDKHLMENVTRNVAFADEIRSYAKISNNLDSIVSMMFSKNPPSPAALTKWLPDRDILLSYLKVIELMKQVQFQNFLIKDKADYLLNLGQTNNNLSEQGKRFLMETISFCNKSISDWQKVEPIYLARYNLLLNDLETREKQQVLMIKS